MVGGEGGLGKGEREQSRAGRAAGCNFQVGDWCGCIPPGLVGAAGQAWYSRGRMVWADWLVGVGVGVGVVGRHTGKLG